MKSVAFLLAAAAGGAIALATVAHAQSAPDPEAAAPSAQTSEPVPDSGEPVITDSAFEAELPALDPDMNAPLEPIESFEVQDAGTANAPGEPIADAPLPDDPALTEPLEPIATFDVEVPPADAVAEDDDGEAPTIRYTFDIVGLDEVELQGRFRDLSALEEADGETTNGAMIAARAEEDELLAVRLLRSEGYYDATAVSSIEQPVEPDAPIRVTLTAVPGPRYSFGEIAISGPETAPPGLAREALPLKSGEPIVAELVEAAEANVRLKLPQQGYPFAKVDVRDILLDPETRLGDYTLPVQPGNRSRFAGFTTEGNLAFDAEHVETLSRFSRDELYDSRKVDDLREAMIATNLFSSVSAEPVATGEMAEDGSEYVNILVRQEKGPARSISGSAGYNTGEGFRLEAAWEHRNLFPPEGGLRVAAVAGTQEQSARLQFRRMNAGKRDRSVLLQLEAGRRNFNAFEGYTARINGLISRESTPIWQKKWTYAYGAEIIATNESQEGSPNFDLSDTFFLAGLTGQVGYDASDSLLDPTKGFRLLARINPEASLREPTQPYIRNIIEGSAYFPVTDNIVIAGRTRLGSIYGATVPELAPSRRFFAGGGGSVRGFGYQELGPKIEVANPDYDPTDPEETDDPTRLIPLGGRSLAEFAIEARYRFGNYGIVPFIDAGQVYDSEFPTFSSLRFGAGIGGRLYTNFGPLRVDVATPIGRKPGESWIALYISIGQAF